MKTVKQFSVLLAICGFMLHTFAQEDHTITEVDSLYKEDQFYTAFTYNILRKKPKGMSQNGFSSGFHLGFIKDMPINTQRNNAIGLGLGYNVNFYNQNMLIDKASNGTATFTLLQDIAYTKNRFVTHAVELPLEFRWRTSTPTSYKFWRIYSGIKLSYLFATKTKFKGELGEIKHNNLEEFNKLQYGLTLSVGYNTWNFHVYYGLNSVFDKATYNNNDLNLRIVKIGLIFYIL